MKKLLLFSFCWVFAYPCLAQNNSAIHDQAVSTLRDFRTALNLLPSESTHDSLLLQTVKLLNAARSMHDTTQLRRINDYFQYAENTLNNAGADDKAKIIGFIHADLLMKTALPDTLKDLNLTSTLSFGDPQTVVINAQFSDKIPHQKCRVYWAFYFGGTQEDVMTSKNPPGGHSSLFQNPYQLNVNLPGYITFWLVDLPTNQVYKSDMVYTRITASTKLDLFFTPVTTK